MCDDPPARILDFNGALNHSRGGESGGGGWGGGGMTFKSILIRGLAKRALSSTATTRHTHCECKHNLDIVTGEENTTTQRRSIWVYCVHLANDTVGHVTLLLDLSYL